MTRLPMSRAAAGLLRGLLARAGPSANRILLSSIRSVEWHSLTFSGERHVIDLRIVGERSIALAARLTAGLEEAEFAIPGQIVADVALAVPPLPGADGSVAVTIEALTIAG